jgi:hypothetical protein
MKKLGIALLAISMCFACGDAEDERDALAEGEYENLEDAYTRDNATLDALDRCDIATATIYNDDELLACEAAFETCSNLEIGLLTNKLECEAGFTENCDDDAMQISPECAEGYATLAPKDNTCDTMCWFQQLASGSNWCGAGTDLANTACPGSGEMSEMWHYDLEADRACRRHDHGSKSAPAGPAVKLGCDIDRDLENAGGHNAAVNFVFGSWGIAQTWGCFDDGSYSCWNWKSKWWGGYWRYGSYCSGEHTHYGPWRYSAASATYGYKSKPKTCPDDIF